MTEGKEMILVADDEPAVLQICMRILRRFGYEVVGVKNGAQALDYVANHPVDLVLSDIKMPDIDGLEVLRQVKELSPELPVVLITGFGNMETAMQAVRLGAGDFVLKPFHAQELRLAVEEALTKTRLWRENVRLKTLLPLVQIGEALLRENDVDALAHQVVDELLGRFDLDMVALLLVDENLGPSVRVGAWPEGWSVSSLRRLAQLVDPTSAEVISETRLAALDMGGADNGHVGDLAVTPLMTREEPLGYLVVGRTRGQPDLGEGDLESLGILGREVAIALENARLFQQTRAYADHLEDMVAERTRELRESEARLRRLYEASRQLRSTLDFDQVISDVLSLAMSLAGAAFGALFVADADDGQLTKQLERGDSWLQEGADRVVANTVAEQDGENASSLVLDRIGGFGKLPADADGSALALPMVREGNLVAVLVLLHPETSHFSAAHTDLLQPWSGQAASILGNARVFRQTLARLNRVRQDLRDRAQQLEMTTQQLVRADRLAVIGQLAAGISHEMGNIIAPLQVFAELLADTKPSSSTYDSYVEQIQSITDRARRILRQFTDFARKEPRKGEQLDIQDVIQQALQLMDYSLDRKGIQVTFDRVASLPPVNVDPGQMEQVFVNLIVNARDAMPEGGELAVSARSSQRPGGKGYVEVVFRDTGVGIAPEHLSHIFEPFFTTKDPGKGTGLGLFISYGIVERHGGSFDVDSQLGEGTAFSIRLPAAEAKPTVSEEGELLHAE